MPTLLQTLLIETLPEDTDPILRLFIDTILPAMERAFCDHRIFIITATPRLTG